MESVPIRFNLNGNATAAEVKPHHTLLSVLRNVFNLTGSKEGCGTGDCGACVVLLDNKPINSCLTLAVEVDNKNILTIEGLTKDGNLHPLQEAFLKHEAFQCGFCTPGLIMTAYGLLLEKPHPSIDEVQHALAGNLCRCTGYERIIDAVVEVGEIYHGG